MPEGDTIHRTAARLRQVLPGRTIGAARGREWLLDAGSLAGATVADVEARGKHLLMRLDDGRVIHGHCGMTGSWHVYLPAEPWTKPAKRAALVLETSDAVIVFFSPKTLELLTATAARRHPQLSRLGPDLLAVDVDLAGVRGRFRRHNRTAIGEAVMNQTICCGIGNIYKSELLFLQNLDPFAQVATVDDERLLDLLELGRELMQFNLQGAQRTTRAEGDGGRLWVYGRARQPCYLCGDTIQISRQGDAGRTTYWCPTCQPSVGAVDSSRQASRPTSKRRRPAIKGCD